MPLSCKSIRFTIGLMVCPELMTSNDFSSDSSVFRAVFLHVQSSFLSTSNQTLGEKKTLPSKHHQGGDMILLVTQYYQSLYEPILMLSKTATTSYLAGVSSRLTSEQMTKLEQDFTEEEMDAALRDCANASARDLMAYSSQFYLRYYWADVCPILVP